MKKTFLYIFSALILINIFFSCKQNLNSAGVKTSPKAKSLPVNPANKKHGNLLNNVVSKLSSNSQIVFAANKNKVALASKNENPFVLQGKISDGDEKEDEGYDGPDKREEFEFNRIKDPATGKVPVERLIAAKQKTIELKNSIANSSLRTTQLSWSERGPIYDSIGLTNGNTRGTGIVSGVNGPNTYTSGRIRAVLIDASDATGNTVFTAGVDGGLWKCTNFITGTVPNWTVINDFFSNLAISWIAQDPASPDIMYFSTGEPVFNADRVLGAGIWKSIDHGATWNLLSSTASFKQTFRIVIDNNHNIYVAEASSSTSVAGLFRSSNGGSTWTDITPSSISTSFASKTCTDIELSSTGKLHASFGYFGKSAYRYTTIPATATTTDWNMPLSGLPDSTGFDRIELATKGDTIYAAPTNTSDNVISTYRSMDGGATWVRNNTSDYTTSLSNTQGWYNITLEINPLTASQILVGGLDEYLSIDSGKNVNILTHWVQTPPYVHADHHFTKWILVGGESRIIIACDGGIFLSRDGGATFADRNQNLSIKQFYSVAIHPTVTNYFLAGAQDNGVHQFTKPGKASSIEVIGGDGAFTAIDQDQAQYQFGAYVYNQYRRSTDGGTTWSQVNFSSSAGMFINPWDYDNNNNILYGAYTANGMLRWTNPATTTSASLVSLSLNNNIISTVTVSPYTANMVYIGTNGTSGASRLLKLSGANATPIVTDIKGTGMSSTGYVSCINTGTSDQNLLATFSSYGVGHVWLSNNGGTSWTLIDGNLPDIPVRWVMFYPGSNTKAIIATETGVWETTNINGPSTVWIANSTFPTVRTDMLRFRSYDGTIAAATHGRGLWTATISLPVTTWTGNTNNNWTISSNWDNGVPDASTNAIIPNVSPKAFPVISSIQAVFNLTINSLASVTINNSDSLQIGGLFTNNGTISGAGITTLLSGGLGSVTGIGSISNFALLSGARIDPSSALSITGVLKVNGTLITNGNITLKSSATATATIAPITNGSISGNITVERYFSDRRSWRLLGIPFSSSSQTIKSAWQEGATLSIQDPNNPYGTHITTFVGDVRAANYDAVKPASSIRTYSSDSFNSDSLHTPNTSSNILSNPAYFLFVRGNRSVDLTNTAAHNTATLRITGAVNTGNDTVGVAGILFSLIPNPYPSTLDFDSIKAQAANSGLNTFYVWDATLGSVGQYRSISITGFAPNYKYTATPGGFDNTWRFIESGTAFFIPGSSTMSFTENMKSAGTPPSSVLRISAPTETQLAINLNIVNADNTVSLADGVREVFDNNYAATIDNNDAKKIEGFEYNFGINSNNEILSVERRPLPVADDVIALKLWNTAIGNYQFEIQPANISPSQLPLTYLHDNYLNSYTPIDLTNVTTINFSVTSDAASAATNRFSIVFSKVQLNVPAIVIYPNPVQNGFVKLQLNNMPKGTYFVRLVNNLGQVMLTREINHAEGTSTETINTQKVKGTFMLEVTKPDNTKSVNKLIIN